MSGNDLPFRFERFDRLQFAGNDYVYLRDTDCGHVLRNVRCDIEETFTHSEMAAKVLRADFRHDRRFFAEGNVHARATSGVASLAEIPPEEMPKLIFKYEFCTRFLKMEAEHKASRSDKSLDGEKDEHGNVVEKGAIATIAAEIACAAVKEVQLAGQKITTFKPPCAKTLRRWLTEFEAGGLLAYALRERHRDKGNRNSRLAPEIYELLDRYADKCKSEKKPRVKTLYNDLLGELEAINASRHPTQRLRTPSKRALSERIAALPAFAVYAARHGLEAAKRYFRLVAGKADAVRPGERVEIDEWTINLQNILIKAGLWAKLSKAEQRALTGRRLACVAIDVATKCILGVRIAPKASGDLARTVLRMVVSDKSDVAAAAGAKTPWDMRLTPDLMVSDGGPAFISDLWIATVADIMSERDVAKCKMPHLRGTIERAFRTCDINLLPRFTGRSFANIDDKGDYDSEARASLTEEDLAWSIVRWVVDVYHNEPHDGLKGETPRNAWLRLGRSFGLRPPPDRDRKLAALGVRLTRKLSMRGVRLLGNHYSCKAVAEDIMQRHLHEVDIRVDEADLGRISVRIGTEWHIAKCTGDGFDGVSADTWCLAMADLRRRFAKEAEITLPIVLEALAAIKARAAEAERLVGIVSLAPAADLIAKAEEELVAGFCVPNDSSAAEADHDTASETNRKDPFDARFETGGKGDTASDTPVAQRKDAPPEDDGPSFTTEED